MAATSAEWRLRLSMPVGRLRKLWLKNCSGNPRNPWFSAVAVNILTCRSHFARNLAPELTHYSGERIREIETYEGSRHRNDNHNIFASASMARARGIIRSGGVARTQRNATKESKAKPMRPTTGTLPLDVYYDQPHSRESVQFTIALIFPRNLAPAFTHYSVDGRMSSS